MPRTTTKSILKRDGETSTAQAGSSRALMKKTVCWGDLYVYEFPNILGDNPAVSDGAPLSIGWKHTDTNIVSVEYYEFLRQNNPRRRRKELVIPSAARDTYLLGLGYNLNQLIDAAEETKKIRKSRQANMKGTWDKFKSVLDAAILFNKKKPEPKIVAAMSG